MYVAFKLHACLFPLFVHEACLSIFNMKTVVQYFKMLNQLQTQHAPAVVNVYIFASC